MIINNKNYISRSILFLAFILVTISVIFFSPLSSTKRCNPSIMEEHYEMHKENMAQLVEYVHEAIDDDCGIDIEIEDDRITMFHKLSFSFF